MPTEKAAPPEAAVGAQDAASVQSQINSAAELASQFVGAPLRMYMTLSRGWLETASRSLNAQAEHIARLSKCRNPAEVLSCQAEFTRKALTTSLEDGQKLFDSLRMDDTPKH